MWLGVVVCAASAGLLTYYVFTAGQLTGAAETQALGNIDLVERILVTGSFALGIGLSVTLWGEQILLGILILASGALFAAPNYLPLMLGSQTSKVVGRAMDALHNGGIALGIISLVVIVIDVVVRVRERSTKGAKADSMKYGKGINQEKNRENRFLGKCWQLPYCRQFVKERCPIYHSKRTCWKEQVGCMCEEQVIRDAMENKVIPKDEVLAAKMIPRNNKLTTAQKAERCKNCVIYNEHQVHKYKAALPLTVVLFALVYLGLHGPLVDWTSDMIEHAGKAAQGLAMAKGAPVKNTLFAEILLGALVLVVLSYSLKVLEFAIFKLKI